VLDSIQQSKMLTTSHTQQSFSLIIKCKSDKMLSVSNYVVWLIVQLINDETLGNYST
jgi:hypothetical protein